MGELAEKMRKGNPRMMPKTKKQRVLKSVGVQRWVELPGLKGGKERTRKQNLS